MTGLFCFLFNLPNKKLWYPIEFIELKLIMPWYNYSFA